jgi:hypothetical protein
MATRMHQAAFPGQDISDRPAPDTVVDTVVDLVESDRPSGRYRLADLRRTDSGLGGWHPTDLRPVAL